MFYNTGIATYIWIVTNRKPTARKGKVQLINGVDFYEKMRKSLGSKRNYISNEQREQLSAIYHSFKEGEHCKIFDNNDFGYWRITVERPLKLNFQTSAERLELLKEQTPFQNLAVSKKKGKAGEKEAEEGQRLQELILSALASLGNTQYKNRNAFIKAIKECPALSEAKLHTPVFKSILSALSERDETADICTDSDGNPEPDSELRDNENIPLKEDIGAYFEREVKPYVPDAWIDESKTKIGYEIPFTRHFYMYKELRPLEVIDKEINDLEREIQEMLKEVTS